MVWHCTHWHSLRAAITRFVCWFTQWKYMVRYRHMGTKWKLMVWKKIPINCFPPKKDLRWVWGRLKQKMWFFEKSSLNLGHQKSTWLLFFWFLLVTVGKNTHLWSISCIIHADWTIISASKDHLQIRTLVFCLFQICFHEATKKRDFRKIGKKFFQFKPLKMLYFPV